VRRLERTISWLVWGVWVLWAIGLLPVLLEEADGIRWKVGSSTLTLRNLIEGGLNVAVALLLALWLSSALEARLLRAAGGAALSLRKMVANALRAVLVFVAVLLALWPIDLTTLSVLGGAIGVGIGLGLQSWRPTTCRASWCWPSALRIGDQVRVDGFEGRITDIRALHGDSQRIGQRVGGAQRDAGDPAGRKPVLADRRVWQSTVVGVEYGCDVDLVQRLLRQAALSSKRGCASRRRSWACRPLARTRWSSPWATG
jgi:small-conductance mechanosensitive channel